MKAHFFEKYDAYVLIGAKQFAHLSPTQHGVRLKWFRRRETFLIIADAANGVEPAWIGNDTWKIARPFADLWLPPVSGQVSCDLAWRPVAMDGLNALCASVPLPLYPPKKTWQKRKISDLDVLEIKGRLRSGEIGVDLAREFGVAAKYICVIARGGRRATVGEILPNRSGGEYVPDEVHRRQMAARARRGWNPREPQPGTKKLFSLIAQAKKDGRSLSAAAAEAGISETYAYRLWRDRSRFQMVAESSRDCA